MPHWSASDGCRIFYLISRTASSHPPVVFLNGFAQTAVYWLPVARFLAPMFTTICYDRRCQGRSDIGAMPPTVNQHVDDLAGLLDHLGLDSVHLVGLSHGGLVAAATAQKEASRVSRLVVCNTSSGASTGADSIIRQWRARLHTEGLRGLAAALVRDGIGSRFRKKKGNMLEAIIDAVVTRISIVGLDRQLAAMSDDPPLKRMLQSIAIPTLILAAGDDRIAPAPESKKLAASIAAAFVQVDHVGHSFPAESPQLFSELVKDFLTGDDPHPKSPQPSTMPSP